MANVTQCPTDASEKHLASTKLGCGSDTYGNDQYICVPNEAKTSLVELCNEGIMGIVDKGKPLNYYNVQGVTTVHLRITTYSKQRLPHTCAREAKQNLR